MDDFDDFDNELDDLLKSAIAEDKNKSTTKANERSKSVNTPATSAKPKPRISLFEDEDEPQLQRKTGIGAKTSSSSTTKTDGNSFLEAIFGTGVSSQIKPVAQTTHAVHNQQDVESEGGAAVDPLDAILSRTKARKAALQRPVVSQPATMEDTKPNIPSDRKVPSSPLWSESDEEESKDNAVSRTTSPKRDKQDEPNIAQPPTSKSRVEPSMTTAAAKTRPSARKGPLLDMNSLTEIPIRKIATVKSTENLVTKPPVAVDEKTTLKNEASYEQPVIVQPSVEVSAATEIATGVDDLVKDFEAKMSDLRNQLEHQRTNLQQKDEELKQLRDQKTSEWQTKIESELQQMREVQQGFFSSLKKEITELKEQNIQDKGERRIEMEQRLLHEEQERLKESQRKTELEEELKTRYQTMVEKINQANSLVVSKMRTEHERELLFVERIKQKEVDQVMQAFDQGRTMREISNRMETMSTPTLI